MEMCPGQAPPCPGDISRSSAAALLLEEDTVDPHTLTQAHTGGSSTGKLPLSSWDATGLLLLLFPQVSCCHHLLFLPFLLVFLRRCWSCEKPGASNFFTFRPLWHIAYLRWKTTDSLSLVSRLGTEPLRFCFPVCLCWSVFMWKQRKCWASFAFFLFLFGLLFVVVLLERHSVCGPTVPAVKLQYSRAEQSRADWLWLLPLFLYLPILLYVKSCACERRVSVVNVTLWSCSGVCCYWTRCPAVFSDCSSRLGLWW